MRQQHEHFFQVRSPFSRTLGLISALALLLPACFAQDARNPQVNLTADQIVAAMVSRNKARAAALRAYEDRRTYILDYRGFPGDRSAKMIVDANYAAPAATKFTVLSESGSKFLIDHVLRRILSGEQESQDSHNRKEIGLNPENYRFEFLGRENTSQRAFYVFRVKPKVKNKFVYRGKVWIDATDFAVVKIEAEPAKNPSFWIRHTHIEQDYAQFGSFWLPIENTSTSNIRLLHGTATLKIEYKDYTLRGMRTAAVAPSYPKKTF